VGIRGLGLLFGVRVGLLRTNSVMGLGSCRYWRQISGEGKYARLLWCQLIMQVQYGTRTGVRYIWALAPWPVADSGSVVG